LKKKREREKKGPNLEKKRGGEATVRILSYISFNGDLRLKEINGVEE